MTSVIYYEEMDTWRDGGFDGGFPGCMYAYP